MRVFKNWDGAVIPNLTDRSGAVAELRGQMDDDDWVYLSARADGFNDAAARELVESLEQMREMGSSEKS